MADQLAGQLRLGIASLDEQHADMLGLLNAFQLAVAGRRSRDEIRMMADTALAAVRAHFRYEDALCDKSSYPRADEHRFQHEQLLFSASQLAEDAYEGRCNPDELSENIDLLRSLYMAHVVRDDRALADHLGRSGTL